MKTLFGILTFAALCWPASELAAQNCTGGQGGMYAMPAPSYGGGYVPRQMAYSGFQLGVQFHRMPPMENYVPQTATYQGGGYGVPCQSGGYYAYPGGGYGVQNQNGSSYAYQGGGSPYAYQGGGNPYQGGSYPPPAVMGYPEGYAPTSFGAPSGYCPTCGAYHR